MRASLPAGRRRRRVGPGRAPASARRQAPGQLTGMSRLKIGYRSNSTVSSAHLQPPRGIIERGRRSHTRAEAVGAAGPFRVDEQTRAECRAILLIARASARRGFRASGNRGGEWSAEAGAEGSLRFGGRPFGAGDRRGCTPRGNDTSQHRGSSREISAAARPNASAVIITTWRG